MNSELLILLFGLSCLVVGSLIGWAGTYYWLLRNSKGDPDSSEGKEWYL